MTADFLRTPQDPAELFALCKKALAAFETYRNAARDAAGTQAAAAPGGADECQRELHGLAWVATYAASLGALLGWAEQLEDAGEFGRLEALILRVAFGEYLDQATTGISMSQVEFARPSDLGLEDRAARLRADPACAE